MHVPHLSYKAGDLDLNRSAGVDQGTEEERGLPRVHEVTNRHQYLGTGRGPQGCTHTECILCMPAPTARYSSLWGWGTKNNVSWRAANACLPPSRGAHVVCPGLLGLGTLALPSRGPHLGLHTPKQPELPSWGHTFRGQGPGSDVQPPFRPSYP